MIDNLANSQPSRHRSLPITSVVVFGVGGLIACAVGLALFLGLGSASHNTRTLWVEQADTLIESLETSLTEQLSPVIDQGEWIRSRISTGALDPDDHDVLDAFMAGTLGGTTQVAGIAIVDAFGRSRRWGRDDTTPVDEDWSNREVIVRWLSEGRERDSMSWQAPFWTPTLDTTVLLHDAPLVRDGKYLGMMGQVVPINSLSLSLVREYTRSGLIPFVLHGRDRVLAHPLLTHYTGERAENVAALPALDELGDPVLARIWAPDVSEPDSMRGLSGSQASIVRYKGTDYLFLYRTLRRFGPEHWTVGAYVDTQEHGGREVRRIVLAASGGLAGLVVAVVIAMAVGFGVSRRVSALSAAARAVEAGNLDQVPVLKPSGIREIDDAARAFGEMISGLRERDLIRATLGRFVPEQVAHRMLNAGGQLEPRTTEATLLFCDIEGFTQLTEALGPQGIVAVLNEFFSEMVTILERHGGIVTQFQGDAILATFNVPIPDPRHATKALRAALEMESHTESSTFAGQRVRIRIGINSGAVIAGAVGASGRQSYTVHGDAVNLAARLESLNKTYQTRILASEHTTTMTDGFILREVERTQVRGQSRPVKVFEVEGIACHKQ